MAVPAAESGSGLVVFPRYPDDLYHADKILVAADAVFLYNVYPRLLDPDNLRLSPGRKDGCMPETVHRFEIILPEEVVLRYMTVVAGCNFPVAAVVP